MGQARAAPRRSARSSEHASCLFALLEDDMRLGAPCRAFASLIERGWLAEEDAQKRVSDVTVVMRRDKQLERVDRGVVRLHPQLKIPLEQLDATQGTSTDPD